MKVLVIGSGGREHAIAWRLVKSASVTKVYCAPGNPGMAALAECIPAKTVDDYLRIAEELHIDLTVVGPEAPLVAGVVDKFRAMGLAIVGPTASAAQLEGSKSFAKDFMIRAGIATANYLTVASEEEARRALAKFDYPLVLKADGLAAGKGVIIVQDEAQALAAIPGLLTINGRLVIEDFLDGEEVSFIVLSDGSNVIPFQPTQDHKAIFDGDRGPNTGGMGAYCDSSILTGRQHSEIMSGIIEPAISQMAGQGMPFTGFLYAGLMMTSRGPRLLEFNVRLGDPETQVLMHRMDSDFAEVLLASSRDSLSGVSLNWKPGPSVCVVMAAHGYPGDVRTGDVISGIEDAGNTGATVFQAGTRQAPEGIVTSGGRVLGITASAPHLSSAIDAAYTAVNRIHFEGMQFRTDIGAKGLRRMAESAPTLL